MLLPNFDFDRADQLLESAGEVELQSLSLPDFNTWMLEQEAILEEAERKNTGILGLAPSGRSIIIMIVTSVVGLLVFGLIAILIWIKREPGNIRKLLRHTETTLREERPQWYPSGLQYPPTAEDIRAAMGAIERSRGPEPRLTRPAPSAPPARYKLTYQE